MRRLIRILLFFAAVAIGICFVGAALGGRVDPRVWAWPGILTMTLTAWAGVLAVVTVVAGLTRSWLSLGVCVIAWIAGYDVIRAVSPLYGTHAATDGA